MEVPPEELHQLMQRPGPRALLLVDVRDASDFLISHLDGAEHIPLSALQAEGPKRLGGKDTPIVVYCHRGESSRSAAEVLQAQGYEFVFQLTGGLEAWKKKVDPAFLLQDDLPPASADALSESAPSSSTSAVFQTTVSPPLPSASQREVSPEELRELMNLPGPRPFRLIDVREEDEFQICRLEWAELIPLAGLPEQAPSRLVDKDRPIVVYCHHGMRSQHACDWLRRAGYLHVLNLTGGIEAWADRVEPTMRRY